MNADRQPLWSFVVNAPAALSGKPVAGCGELGGIDQ
jgi:hypothetical protein